MKFVSINKDCFRCARNKFATKILDALTWFVRMLSTVAVCRLFKYCYLNAEVSNSHNVNEGRENLVHNLLWITVKLNVLHVMNLYKLYNVWIIQNLYSTFKPLYRVKRTICKKMEPTHTKCDPRIPRLTIAFIRYVLHIVSWC